MKTRTVGISPKLIAAVVTAVVTYIAGQELVDLDPWVEMILQGVLVALATFAAGPGTVARVRDDDAAGERGYSLIEVLAALFIGLLVVIVLLALLDRL